MTVKYEDAGIARFAVQHIGGRELVVVPARRNLFAAVFMLAWLGGWAVGWTHAVGALSKGFQPFLAFWLVAWTIGGIAAVAGLIWMMAGRETIHASQSGGLQIGYGALGFFRQKNYRPDLIKELGLHARSTDIRDTGLGFGFRAAGPNNAALRFDYGGRSVYLGIGLDAAEARSVLDYLKARLPRSSLSDM